MSSSTAVMEQTSSIVYVLRPNYPNWVKKVMHPDLEVGPASFDAAELEHWLAPGQQDGWVRGHAIYEALKAEEDGLPSCLGLLDLNALQSRGIDFFRKYFSGKAVFGWRSVVENQFGYLYVPYAVVNDGKVVVGWDSLGSDFSSINPALRSRKK